MKFELYRSLILLLVRALGLSLSSDEELVDCVWLCVSFVTQSFRASSRRREQRRMLAARYKTRRGVGDDANT